jgi:hypothetical protein
MTALRHVLPMAVRHALREQYNQVQQRGIGGMLRRNAMLTDAWLRERVNRRWYRVLAEPDLRAAKKSETVFVFGSGYSLNELMPAEWTHFARHDTFGFNNFVYEKWIPIGFQLLRGGVETTDTLWRAYAAEFTGILNANPHCANTIFLVQGEYLADFCNRLIGYGYLRRGAGIFRYHTNREDGPPTRSFAEGLRHEGGTLSDAVNAVSILGWKRIVLVGVDLYDSRYFWMGPHETQGVDERGAIVPAATNARGIRYDGVHNTVRNGVVERMGQWREFLARETGAELTVYNPRSLLSAVLPVYRRDRSAE